MSDFFEVSTPCLCFLIILTFLWQAVHIDDKTLGTKICISWIKKKQFGFGECGFGTEVDHESEFTNHDWKTALGCLVCVYDELK